MTPAQADAMLDALIRRVLAAQGTTSEHLLILADWMDEAAAVTLHTAEAAILARRAAELRNTLAPMLAEPARAVRSAA
jgi:hypothetical protein